MNTVALTLICKNEIANIAELLNRVCPVLDEVHVVDTGSTDGTLEVIKGLGYQNLHLHHFDWVDDFSAARNFSLSKVQSTDWVFWLDCDDLIDPVALKKFKDELLEDPTVDVWCLPYHYGGKTVISRERFIRRSVSPKWQCAIHEYLGHSSSKVRHYDGLTVTHNHAGKVREAGRNLRILAKEYEKDPSHTRMSYYYGKELFDAGEHEKAKQVLLAYLDLPVGKYYDDEVSARYRLAMLHVKDKQYQKALDVAERIYHLSRERNRAEYYYVFGEVELALGNIAQAATWYERCLCQPPERGVINGHLWTTMPLNRLMQCGRDLGRWDEVFKWVDRARQYPECAYWIEQVTQYRVHPKDGASEVNLEFGLTALPNAYRVGEEPLLVNIGSYMKFKPTNWVLGERLPFMSGSVDGVAVDTSRSKVLVSELVRVLKPGGKFVSNTVSLGERSRASIACAVTTCRRPEAFERAYRSFALRCQDRLRIDQTYIVDDGSSNEQLESMLSVSPGASLLNNKDRGHAGSINTLLDVLFESGVEYLVFMEDDFLYIKDFMVSDAIDILRSNPMLGQVLFNRNYAETDLDKERDSVTTCGDIIEDPVRHIIHRWLPMNSPEWKAFHAPGVRSHAHWPGFSFNPGVWRVDALKKVGKLELCEGFEFRYAVRYANAGFVTAFFDDIHCIHLGRPRRSSTLVTEDFCNMYLRQGLSISGPYESAYNLNSTTR